MSEEMKKDNDNPEKGINARISFDAIMKVVDKHRPFEPSDFEKEYFIPWWLVIELLMVVNFAGVPVKIKNAEPQAKQITSNIAKQSQANYVDYFSALQKIRGC